MDGPAAPPAWRVHPAVRGFDRAAATYERGRPGYPETAVRWLAARLRLGRGRVVVDLASGTGQLTRRLLGRGAAVVGVDPTAGMRRVFSRELPGTAVLPGAAEAIPLPSGLADAVVVGQAFHWFRPAPALREIARVLRPHGRLGLVWNVRDDADPLSRRLTELLDRYAGRTPRGRSAAWQREFGRRGGPFGPLHLRSFRHLQRGRAATLVARVLSVSYIASLGPPARKAIAQEVRRIVNEQARRGPDGSVDLPYRTDVYWAARLR